MKATQSILYDLPPVTPQPKTGHWIEEIDDCISRQAVLEYIEGSEAELGHSSENELVCQDIKELPHVTPRPKMGRWMIVDDCEKFIAKCSECGRIEDSRMINKYPYCHCGAKMQEAEDGSK